MLVEAIVRFPISLIKERFGSEEDGIMQARERFKASGIMMVPFINFFYYFFVRFESRTDFITDPELKAMQNYSRFSERVNCALGIFSQQFYVVRPIEWVMGIYDPTKLNALINEFKSIPSSPTAAV